MINKLHKKLTIFCSIFISVILTCVTILYLTITFKQMEQSNFTEFMGNAQNICYMISGDGIIDLSQIDYYNKSGYSIYICDNDTEITYPCNMTSDELLALTQNIFDVASNNYNFINNSYYKHTSDYQYGFSYNTKGSYPYYVYISTVKVHQTQIVMMILYPPVNERISFNHMCIILFLICIAAITILTIFMSFLIKKILNPVVEAQKKQTEFIASASHELRSPLAVITSSISAMELSNDAERQHHSSVALSECSRMSNLIEDLLFLARSDNHSWSINPIKCNPEDILIDCYNHFEERTIKKNLKYIVKLPENSLPLCCIDKNRITQLLIILLDNAISYTDNGSITLSLNMKGNILTFAVADTGIGIPDSDKEKIFDRFYRIETSHTDNNHYGLGLSIAQEICATIKSRLIVSDTIGGGTTFSFSIKLT